MNKAFPIQHIACRAVTKLWAVVVSGYQIAYGVLTSQSVRISLGPHVVRSHMVQVVPVNAPYS